MSPQSSTLATGNSPLSLRSLPYLLFGSYGCECKTSIIFPLLFTVVFPFNKRIELNWILIFFFFFFFGFGFNLLFNFFLALVSTYCSTFFGFGFNLLFQLIVQWILPVISRFVQIIRFKILGWDKSFTLFFNIWHDSAATDTFTMNWWITLDSKMPISPNTLREQLSGFASIAGTTTLRWTDLSWSLVYWLPYSSHTSHHPSLTPCLPWIFYATQKLMLGSCNMVEKQSEAFHTFLWYFSKFKAYRSSKVSSRPDCIFEIHQLW